MIDGAGREHAIARSGVRLEDAALIKLDQRHRRQDRKRHAAQRREQQDAAADRAVTRHHRTVGDAARDAPQEEHQHEVGCPGDELRRPGLCQKSGQVARRLGARHAMRGEDREGDRERDDQQADPDQPRLERHDDIGPSHQLVSPPRAVALVGHAKSPTARE